MHGTWMLERNKCCQHYQELHSLLKEKSAQWVKAQETALHVREPSGWRHEVCPGKDLRLNSPCLKLFQQEIRWRNNCLYYNSDRWQISPQFLLTLRGLQTSEILFGCLLQNLLADYWRDFSMELSQFSPLQCAIFMFW